MKFTAADLWGPGLVVAGFYGVLLLFVFLFQGRLLYFPLREVESTPASAGLAHEEVAIATSDGLTLDAWFVPAANPRAILLFFHGNAGNISQRLDSIRIFHQLGLSVLIFDYRGYGRSEGSPSEDGTYRDAEAAWRYLTEQKGVPADRIVLFGRSLGASIAAYQATRHRPGALIVESGFTSVPDLAAQLYPFLPARRLSRFGYPAYEYLGDVSCPVLVIHSRDDEIIPFAHGERLFAAAREPKRFLELSGGHNDGFLASGRVYTEGLDAFLDEHLPPAP